MLVDHLKRAGVITGPIKKFTGHTRLGWIKSVLLGQEVEISSGPRDFQNFGTYVHEMLFLNKSSVKLSNDEHKRATSMLEALRSNKMVQAILQRSVCEVTRKTVIDDVSIQFTPDAVQDDCRGRDLKTTVCANKEAFIQKAFEYGYFRQAVTYSIAADLNEFIIIGIQKQKPFKVFIVLCSMYKSEMKYATKELEFLLYFYKHYGNFKKLVEKPIVI